MSISRLRTRTLKNSLWIAGACLLLSGCIDKATVFHTSRLLPGYTWEKEDTVRFYPDSLESGHTYRVTVEGRFLTTFPYRQVHLHFWDGHSAPTPIIIDIAANKAKEKGVFVQTLSSNSFRWTPDSATSTLHLVPYMQLERLPGITAIGIRITKQ